MSGTENVTHIFLFLLSLNVWLWAHTKLSCFNTWLAYFQSKFVRPLHWYSIILFYSVLLYSPSQRVFLVRQVLFLILILNRCFLDGFEQNKMRKGVIICLHHYISFCFKFVCFPRQWVGNFSVINVKTK